jgi:hypothetical protein
MTAPNRLFRLSKATLGTWWVRRTEGRKCRVPAGQHQLFLSLEPCSWSCGWQLTQPSLNNTAQAQGR